MLMTYVTGMNFILVKPIVFIFLIQNIYICMFFLLSLWFL